MLWKRTGISEDNQMLAQKRFHSFKECVLAHWSRGPAPKCPGLKRTTETMIRMIGRGALLWMKQYRNTVDRAGREGMPE